MDKKIPPDIPLPVRDRLPFKPLSPAENEEFLRRQVEFEAAYRRTGDPEVLFSAILHAWWSRQTIPGWMVLDIGNALIRNRTDKEIERYHDRMRDVRRYIVVRDLREKKGRTKPAALECAVKFLAGEPAEGTWRTIEVSYDKVRKSLEREGRESEFFYLVALFDRDHVSPGHIKKYKRKKKSKRNPRPVSHTSSAPKLLAEQSAPQTIG